MASRTVDLTKFRKEVTKSIPGVSVGFRDPTTWIDSGNYALNWLISGDFRRGFPLGKVCALAGDPGSGKSLIATSGAIRDAQRQGVYVVVLDSENALDKTWMKKQYLR